MSPGELRDSLRPSFEPFRIVLTDGAAYEIRHPDLLWVGKRTAYACGQEPSSALVKWLEPAPLPYRR
jgi:hypothetical protein